MTSSSRYLGEDLTDISQPVDPETRLYNFDAIGNRESAGEGTDPATTYTANSLNQYGDITIGGSTGSITYDADGNITAIPPAVIPANAGIQSVSGWNLTYNAENRLATVAPNTPVDGDTKVEFVYDYMGRRVKKASYAYNSGSWQLEKEVLFVYDGWNVIEEITVVGATETSRYFVWGLDLSQTLQGAGGVGGLHAMVDGVNIYHYLFDANGNVGQLVNAVDGVIAAHYEFDPFGNEIFSSGEQVDSNPYRFSTRHFDSETELLYYGYRFFDSELGRWISRDPFGESGGVNLYNFIENDSINLVDPLGLILFAFDGTGNNSERDYKKGEFANVYILFRAYDDIKRYYPGPGSSTGTRAYGGATGAGVSNRIKSAYEDFERLYEPVTSNFGEIIATVDIIGFSRGAATAREFANVLSNPEHDRFRGSALSR